MLQDIPLSLPTADDNMIGGDGDGGMEEMDDVGEDEDESGGYEVRDARPKIRRKAHQAMSAQEQIEKMEQLTKQIAAFDAVKPAAATPVAKVKGKKRKSEPQPLVGMGENQESAAVVLAPLDQTVLPAPEAPKRRKSEPLSALSLQDYQEANPFLFVKDANTSAYVDLTKDETSPPPQQRTKPGKKTKKGGNKSKGLVLPPKTKKLIDKLNNLGVPFENFLSSITADAAIDLANNPDTEAQINEMLEMEKAWKKENRTHLTKMEALLSRFGIVGIGGVEIPKGEL